MITTESLQNLDGSVNIPTEQILYLKNSKLLTGSGTEIIITGGSSSGGGSTGGGSTNTTEIQDLTLEYTSTAIDAATDNIIEITQETDQGNFDKFEIMVIQNEFILTPDVTDHLDVMNIQMKVKSAGYQMVKILLFDNQGKIINFNRVGVATVQSTLNTNIKIDITATGFMLVTNSSYELANIFNTDKMPVAGVGGWYALTSSTDATANFNAMFSSPVSVAKVKIYRCGAASTTFNGGSSEYDVIFTDAANNKVTVNVPKVDNTTFLTLDGAKESTLGISGAMPSIDSKVKRFTLGVSTDGINFTDISTEGVTTQVQNSVTTAYVSTETFPKKNINSRKLFFKLPDTDIPDLNKVRINMWRLEVI